MYTLNLIKIVWNKEHLLKAWLMARLIPVKRLVYIQAN